MEDLRELFVHLRTDDEYDEFGYYTGEKSDDDIVDYGEGFIGMARHVSQMPGLDRIIFEDCPLSGEKVVAPHLNLKPYPFWLCPEYVAGKAGCSFQDAAKLLDCWVILDATQKMVNTFIGWVKRRGAGKALPYFEKLATAAAEAESVDPDDAAEAEGIVYEVPETYQYHVVGEYDEDEKPWLERQPRWYQNTVRKVRACENPDQLAAIGKDIYRKALNHHQAGVFWHEYNLKKAALEKAVRIGPTARGMIQSIEKANGNLAAVGAWLYKIQQGKVKIPHPPAKREWVVIWRKYNERKEEHAARDEKRCDAAPASAGLLF